MKSHKILKKINEVVQLEQILQKFLSKYPVGRKNVKTDKRDI